MVSASAAAAAYPRLRLMYFALRARAEPARMLLRYAGIPYEDEVVGRDWAKLKPTKTREGCGEGTQKGISCHGSMHITVSPAHLHKHMCTLPHPRSQPFGLPPPAALPPALSFPTAV